MSCGNSGTSRPLTLVDILRWRASATPDAVAYRFYQDGVEETERRTYGELYRRACAVANYLCDRSLGGQTVLLLHTAGLEFLEAFLGTMMAKAIPVAIPMPDNITLRRTLPRIRAIAEKARASALIVNSEDPALLEKFSGLVRVSHVSISEGEHPDPGESPQLESIAFLQFTSGSTTAPRGTAITYSNLAHQLSALSTTGRYDSQSLIVNWMPHFHDYGLISGLLLPLYTGVPFVGMPPAAFLRRPMRWLQLINRYRGTHSCGPPFAYDYCCRYLTREDLEDLDLSCWRAAGIGAEPINPETLRRFAALTAGHGFELRSFSPAYGLAENTLAVTYTRAGCAPTFFEADAEALSHNKLTAPAGAAITLVGCGRVVGRGTRVRIVHPETRRCLAGNEVGEIWVAGDSVASGYWEAPTGTKQVFQAYAADTNEGPFLRTGDLGVFHGEELFVTGRIKDVVIVGGQNYYPQDLERTAETAHESLRPQSCAAFSVLWDGRERVVLLAEARGDADLLRSIASAIRAAISGQHGIDLFQVILVKTGALCKTSSGKLQRSECRKLYREGILPIQATDSVSDEQPKGPEPLTPVQSEVAGSGAGGCEDPTHTVRTCLALVTGLAPQTIQETDHFYEYGVGSLHLIRLAAELERAMGRRVSPALIFDNPTVRALSLALSNAGSTERRAASRRGGAKENQPIAVIGMDCRFPGADNPEEFWELLAKGEESITRVPMERWDIEKYYSASGLAPNQMNTCCGGFLRNIDLFDRLFFGISKQEANHMDPQQRLALEVAWHALEDAGLNVQRLAGSATGVFVGISNSDYGNLLMSQRDIVSPFAGPGGALSIAANRLSYILGLQGPSMAVDTACSSSLVALHLACESLRRNEIDLAIVGATNLTLAPETTIALSQAGFLSPDGRCKTFDEKANGYVRSEGCAVVILKRLPDAVESGDNVHAVIRGTAVNQDGRSYGLTAPNPSAQRKVILEALAAAATGAAELSYIEAHGTGTALGDAIEMSSIADVIGAAGTPCFVGSVKTNIGHLEAAAGLAGIVKVILMMKHRIIPPHRNLTKLNPNIHLEDSRVRIAESVTNWPNSAPMIAGVSSFGFGGTNAHAIVAQGPSRPAIADPRPQLLTLSARDENALTELSIRYAQFFETVPEELFADACFTANTGRAHFEWRTALVAQSALEAAELLRNRTVSGPAARKSPQIRFHFCGDECELPQALEANRFLYETYQRTLGMLGPGRNEPRFYGLAAEYSIGLLWRRWGLKGKSHTGSHLGSLIAACFEGHTSLSDFVESACLIEQPVDYELKERQPDELIVRISAADGWKETLHWLAQVFVAGSEPDWSAFYEGTARHKIQLPRYPFQRERCWLPQRKADSTA